VIFSLISNILAGMITKEACSCAPTFLQGGATISIKFQTTHSDF